MDNFYSSPSLFQTLQTMDIGATGTVNPNRKHMPLQQKAKNLKLSKGDPPHFMTSGDMISCAWHDTKRVSLLSTVENHLVIDKSVRSKTGTAGYRKVEKPVMVEKYNTFMSGVDRFDQKLGSYAYPHKSQKWYQPLFHRLVETALVNGYIIYKEKNGDNAISSLKFRKAVIDYLLEGFDMSARKHAGRPSGGPPEARLTEKHFPGMYPDPKYKPNCVVCSGKDGKRHQTRYNCKQCNQPMCVVECLTIPHTS
jgi:hypothetical protein